MHVFRCRTLPLSYDYYNIFHRFSQLLLIILSRTQGLRMRIYIPQKITITVKNRLHSRQQPCRSPRLTVIGIGLRKISSKFCLPSVRAARRHCRCLAFRFFYFILCLFSVYTFFMRNPCRGHVIFSFY